MTAPAPKLLADYRPPPFLIDDVTLDFDLGPAATRVAARLAVRRHGRHGQPLVLDGRSLETVSVALDGKALPSDAYEIGPGTLTLAAVPDAFVLETVVTIRPAANTTLMGLYVSNGIFCTQCEAEGFRRITWFLDRPDVMARFRVRITADRAAYPVLLSNGNPIGRAELPDGRHCAEWEDPHRKPAYLFALVAGDLARLEDRFVTRSGREVTLRLYAEAAAIDQCRHALDSLKRSMAWDEQVYGLEYDLDLFMIVGVADFNFGAMENKGLNIFNTSALLARPDTSTDADFQTVERIVAHEYFHNWTGDRVTCRDWFQLTLKEGLTVFRDQQFAGDMHSHGVKRIGDVALLRETQFAEDAGPLAHPIRPASYVEINNFYTRTVYEKGAEVIRMIHTLIGAEAFRKGMDRYFERHDGQAVTCEDFVAAMADVSGRDLARLMRWYGQAGTPEIEVERHYDPLAQTLTLTFRQSTPPTPGQPDKLPLHLPVAIGLIGADGTALPLQLAGENAPNGTSRVLELTEAEQSFTFICVEEPPVPSLLRGFSAPVRLKAGLDHGELAHLLAHDTDPFVRWDAAQSLAAELMIAQIKAVLGGAEPVLDPALPDALGALLDGTGATDPAFVARTLALPGRSFIAQQLPQIEVEAMDRVQRAFQAGIGRRLAGRLASAYEAAHVAGDTGIDTAAMGRRALKNACLAYLVWGEAAGAVDRAERQYREAATMTDRLGALRTLVEIEGPRRDTLLGDFYAAWRHEPLVINKWFALQAGIEDAAAPERVRALMDHPAFTMSNPNRVRALFGTFAVGNLAGFHRRDGAGYRVLADRVVELDPRNPQVAARLLTAFGRWRRYDPVRQQLMRGELERVAALPGLSRDCQEIASKSLG
jgi:aminopeptidase N